MNPKDKLVLRAAYEGNQIIEGFMHIDRKITLKSRYLSALVPWRGGILALFYARESCRYSRFLCRDETAAATQCVGDQAMCSVYLPIC